MPDVASDNVVASSSISSAGLQPWWLEDPLDSSRNIPVNVVKFSRKIKEEQTVYRPLGRPQHVVVRGVVRAELFALKFEFLSLSEYSKFRTLRNSQRTLLLRRIYTGEQWYIVFGTDLDIEEPTPDPNYVIIEIEAAEVDPV